MAQLLADDLEFIAPAPSQIFGTSAQIVGQVGMRIFHYWWVTHFPIGLTVTGPIMVRNAPDPLTAVNYVIVTGSSSLGATSYDLLRTDGPRFPSLPGNFAVATALTSPTFKDTGSALIAFNPVGLPFGAPVSAHINLNNRDYSQPTLVVAPFQLAVVQLIFPDGTTQSTAPGGGGGSVTGPAISVIGNIPTWGNTTGSQLTSGLATATISAGAASAGAVIVANASGHIDASFLPATFVTGPGPTTVGNVPTWANASGSLLGVGYPASAISTGAQSLVLSNATGRIDASFLPATVVNGPATTTLGNVPTWGNTAGTLLTNGLPASATSTGLQSFVLTNASGQIDISFTPQIYSWQQDVNANLHNLNNLRVLDITGTNTGSPNHMFIFGDNLGNLDIGPTSGASASSILSVIQTGRVGVNNPAPASILQVNGPGGLGTTPLGTFVSNSGADSQVRVLQGGSGANAFNASFVAQSSNGNAGLSLQTTTVSKTFTLALTTAQMFSIIDASNQATPYVGSVRFSINTTGQVGIGITTQTHELELGVDDAAKPTTNTWTITSDIRTKRNVRLLEGGLDVIRALEPIEAEYNGKGNTPAGSRVVSFHPEHLRKILPGCVSSVRTKLHPDDDSETDVLGVNIHEIFHHLILAVQQLADQTLPNKVAPKPSARSKHSS